MSADHYRGQVARLRGEVAKLEQKQADERRSAAKDRNEGTRIQGSITRHTSPSLAANKMRQAERKFERAAEHERNAGKLEGDIARKLDSLRSAERNLERALGQERKKAEGERAKAEREEKKRRQEEERHLKEMERQQRRLGQQAVSARRTELAHERALTDEASRRARFAASLSTAKLQSLPQKVTIMFASAGPRDEERLDIAEEARDVQRRLRAAQYRDVVELRHVPALRTTDLIPALNQHKPRVVHFGGHGSEGAELVFQDDQGKAKPVTLEALAATIATVNDYVELVVLNACNTSAQAVALTEHIPAAIGMSTAIGDEAARVFATALYGAIADGFSVQRAVDQARVQLMLDGMPEDQTPQLFTAVDVDPDELVLVRPPDDAFGDSVAA